MQRATWLTSQAWRNVYVPFTTLVFQYISNGKTGAGGKAGTKGRFVDLYHKIHSLSTLKNQGLLKKIQVQKEVRRHVGNNGKSQNFQKRNEWERRRWGELWQIGTRGRCDYHLREQIKKCRWEVLADLFWEAICLFDNFGCHVRWAK